MAGLNALPFLVPLSYVINSYNAHNYYNELSLAVYLFVILSDLQVSKLSGALNHNYTLSLRSMYLKYSIFMCIDYNVCR